MTASARAGVSEAEFLSLPESVQRIELVDGEVIMSPSPSFWHQEVLARLVVELRAWAAARTPPPSVVQAPLDVKLGSDRIVQPDAVVFLDPLPRDVSGPITRIPDLCVEVLSSNRSYDRITKRFLYAEAGVREYWIVDPAGHVERRCGDGLARVELCETQLRSGLLPEFILDVAALLGA